MTIPERTEKSKQGLLKMIKYIQEKYGNTKEMTIMEIGSWTGVSSEIFANHFKTVLCIDPWDSTIGINTQYNMKEVEKIFDDKRNKYINIIKIKKTSFEAFKIYDGVIIDIVYIDGAHDYKNVKQDIFLWKDYCKIIAGHDYWKDRFPGVIKAVDEILGKPDRIFPDTSWIKEL